MSRDRTLTSASEWQRAKHFKVTFRVDVERSGRVRYQFAIDGSPGAAPANRKRWKNTELRMPLVYETQIARADPRRIEQNIPLIVGDLDGFSPWPCPVVGQSGPGVVRGHDDPWCSVKPKSTGPRHTLHYTPTYAPTPHRSIRDHSAITDQFITEHEHSITELPDCRQVCQITSPPPDTSLAACGDVVDFGGIGFHVTHQQARPVCAYDGTTGWKSCYLIKRVCRKSLPGPEVDSRSIRVQGETGGATFPAMVLDPAMVILEDDGQGRLSRVEFVQRAWRECLTDVDSRLIGADGENR